MNLILNLLSLKYVQNYITVVIVSRQSHTYIFFKNYFVVVQLQLSAFTPHHSPLPQPNPPAFLASTPPWFCPCVLYSCSCKPLPPLSPLTSLWLLSDCS